MTDVAGDSAGRRHIPLTPQEEEIYRAWREEWRAEVITRPTLSAGMTGRAACCYCGRAFRPLRATGRAGCKPDAASRDHILPKSRSGALHHMDVSNIRICCRRCNELRGGMEHCTGALLIFLGLLPEPSTDSVRRLGRVWAASSPLFAGLPQ